ncbi:hypothetical protein K7X08_000303 [Anisodus acutangulus]|uniref:Uncharacterized protein n=1 Tax=Anisodus acutangulus TaxID=402998 RepID=A0A9Q1M6Q6_9SOLA|nr:hypothetical protein K7X08_000303 [Anisodus acutangulus]
MDGSHTLVEYDYGAKIVIDCELKSFQTGVMSIIEKHEIQSVSLNSCDKDEFISSLATRNTKNVIDDECLFASDCYNSVSWKDMNMLCGSTLGVEHGKCDDILF